jgi:hypothetical protein
MAGFGKLSRNQIKAISALLSTQTITEAAQLCGVSVRTLHRWLADADFRHALVSAASESISSAVMRLVAGQGDALNTLHELMLGAERESVRRLAAKDWLDTLRQAHELELLEQRISRLEREIKK